MREISKDKEGVRSSVQVNVSTLDEEVSHFHCLILKGRKRKGWMCLWFHGRNLKLAFILFIYLF